MGKLRDNEIQEVLDACKKYNGNATKAAENLPYAKTTFGRYWIEYNLVTPKKHGGKRYVLNENQISEIINSHKTFNGNPFQASRKLPYSRNAIKKYWKLNGLEIKTRLLSESDIEKIVNSYERFKGNMSLASRILPYSYSSIRKYWMKSGLK